MRQDYLTSVECKNHCKLTPTPSEVSPWPQSFAPIGLDKSLCYGTIYGRKLTPWYQLTAVSSTESHTCLAEHNNQCTEFEAFSDNSTNINKSADNDVRFGAPFYNGLKVATKPTKARSYCRRFQLSIGQLGGNLIFAKRNPTNFCHCCQALRSSFKSG